ncbi:MAG: M14 family zinc carboxypeptidase [bacterium]
MKTILLMFCLFMISLGLFSQPKYSEVAIQPHANLLPALARLGICVDEGTLTKDGKFIAVLSSDELDKISREGFSFSVLRDDYTRYIEERNKGCHEEVARLNKEIRERSLSSGNWTVPQGFSLGSMGGFYTLDEVLDKLDSLRNHYPDLISQKIQAGTTLSIEGRPLYYVKISDHPDLTENEPKVLYDALTHAREGIGIQQMFFFMCYLLENYPVNEEIQYLVDTLELYFIPVINPDGYVYNQTIAPSGGGMWRKNRRNNGGGSFGVDLNRNFGYMWGYDDQGSSPYPDDETYRGTAAFSEPETQAVRDFCNEKEVKLSLNYHSYSNLLTYPWGYIVAQTPDSVTFMTYSDLLTRENYYVTGLPGQILYVVNGDINDWMYGEQITKPKIYTFLPEVGNDGDGFWPQVNRIIPLCQENMLQNLLLAHFAYRYAEAADKSPVIIPDKTDYFHFDVKRYGLNNEGTYTVSIQPLDPSVILTTGDPKVYVGMSLFQTLSDSISYTLAPEITPGTVIRFLLSVNNGFYTHSDTIIKYFGTPVVIFADDCNAFDNWSSTKWNTTTAQYVSPPASITDSPYGNYGNNENNSVTLKELLFLTSSPVAVIDFQARWAIEAGYDFVQFKLSQGGINWTALEGRYTHPGTVNQAAGEPLYDGIESEWVPEQVVITGYENQTVKFRYTLESDSWIKDDGFYFDDFSVTVIDMTQVKVPDLEATRYWLSDPLPNPASEKAVIRYRLPEGSSGPATFVLFSVTGEILQRIPVNNTDAIIHFDVRNLRQGLYFCRLESNGLVSGVKKLIVIR